MAEPEEDVTAEPEEAEVSEKEPEEADETELLDPVDSQEESKPPQHERKATLPR